MSSTEKVIVVYQGTCGFCNWCRRFVEKRAMLDTDFVFLALEEEEGKRSLELHGAQIDFSKPDSIVVLKQGTKPLYKWDASLLIGSRLSFPWRQLAVVMKVVPSTWGDGLYNFVAAHRSLLCQFVRCTKS